MSQRRYWNKEDDLKVLRIGLHPLENPEPYKKLGDELNRTLPAVQARWYRLTRNPEGSTTSEEFDLLASEFDDLRSDVDELRGLLHVNV